MLPATPAFLNLGATEVILLALVFMLFFGVDKLPAVGRTVGRLQGEWTRARRQVEREIRTAEERELDELRRFERERELQMRQNSPEFLEEMRVREAARALGLDGADSKPVATLRSEIAASVGRGNPPGDDASATGSPKA